MNSTAVVEKAYELARDTYAGLGVDTDAAIETLKPIAISLHCWQGDDIAGFEGEEGLSGGGIMATEIIWVRPATPTSCAWILRLS